MKCINRKALLNSEAFFGVYGNCWGGRRKMKGSTSIVGVEQSKMK
jgi:hypothetical protein